MVTSAWGGKSPMGLCAQLDPGLVQLTSTKCCDVPGIMLGADDSVVHEVYRTADLMEFSAEGIIVC